VSSIGRSRKDWHGVELSDSIDTSYVNDLCNIIIIVNDYYNNNNC